MNRTEDFVENYLKEGLTAPFYIFEERTNLTPAVLLEGKISEAGEASLELKANGVLLETIEGPAAAMVKRLIDTFGHITEFRQSLALSMLAGYHYATKCQPPAHGFVRAIPGVNQTFGIGYEHKSDSSEGYEVAISTIPQAIYVSLGSEMEVDLTRGRIPFLDAVGKFLAFLCALGRYDDIDTWAFSVVTYWHREGR